MRSLLSLALSTAGILAATPANAQAPAPRLDLAVLYAGVEDAPRTATWLEFLRAHVARAESVALTELSAKAAAGFDVVVVDSPSPYRAGGGFDMPQAARLTRDFTAPTVLIGAAGGVVLQGLQIKLDWL